MKIYNENVYLVIEVDQSKFDLVDEGHTISPSTNRVKYLCANLAERKHISTIFGVAESELDACDYFKIRVI